MAITARRVAAKATSDSVVKEMVTSGEPTEVKVLLAKSSPKAACETSKVSLGWLQGNIKMDLPRI